MWQAVKLIASLPDTGSSSVPGGDGDAEDAVSADVMLNQHYPERLQKMDI